MTSDSPDTKLPHTELPDTEPGGPDILPLIEETAQVDKRERVVGRVRVSTVTDVVEELASAELLTESVEVVRIPVDREVTTIPQIRTEGETTIVPVMEEILVVEKRLILKEELHITRRVGSQNVDVPVELRKQRAVIERMSADMSDIPTRTKHDDTFDRT